MDMGIIFSVVMKIIGWGLDRTAMTKEQKRSMLEFIKISQKSPQPSTRLFEMVDQQELDLEKKIAEYEKSKGQ